MTTKEFYEDCKSRGVETETLNIGGVAYVYTKGNPLSFYAKAPKADYPDTYQELQPYDIFIDNKTIFACETSL